MSKLLRTIVTLLTLIGMISGQLGNSVSSQSHAHDSRRGRQQHDSARPHWHVGSHDHALHGKGHAQHHRSHRHSHAVRHPAKCDRQSPSDVASWSSPNQEQVVIGLPELSYDSGCRNLSLVIDGASESFLDRCTSDFVGNGASELNCPWLEDYAPPIPPRYLQLLSIRC